MEKYLVAQLGARMHYAVPIILHKNGQLHKLYTDIYADSNSKIIGALNYIPSDFLAKSIRRLIGRKIHGVPNDLICDFKLLGVTYAAAKKIYDKVGVAERMHTRFAKEFNKKIVKKGMSGASAVYGFNSGSLELFQAAKRIGLKTVLEQTIAPRIIEKKILEETPAPREWKAELKKNEEIEGFVERERQEWELADKIVCGSDFVKESIEICGGPAEKCVVVPYGVDVGGIIPSDEKKYADKKSRLRVITVGAVGLRKGSYIVKELAEKLKNIAEFRMIGPITCSAEASKELSKYVDVRGSVPRGEMARHYQWADIFLLPSLCEGSATVTYEAMSYGLPVICTPNTGSIVEDNESGYIFYHTDIDGMSKALESLFKERNTLIRLAAGALARSKIGSIGAYEDRLIRELNW